MFTHILSKASVFIIRFQILSLIFELYCCKLLVLMKGNDYRRAGGEDLRKENDYPSRGGRSLVSVPPFHLPAVTVGVLVLQYMSILLVCSEEPGILFFPEDSTLHVSSIVFVCGCNLTLCVREVLFFCCCCCRCCCRSTESPSASTPRQDTVSCCNKAPVVTVCF